MPSRQRSTALASSSRTRAGPRRPGSSSRWCRTIFHPWTKAIPCGPDPDRYVEDIREFEQAGYTHVWVHQIGENQREFVDFYLRELVPRFG